MHAFFFPLDIQILAMLCKLTVTMLIFCLQCINNVDSVYKDQTANFVYPNLATH